MKITRLFSVIKNWCFIFFLSISLNAVAEYEKTISRNIEVLVNEYDYLPLTVKEVQERAYAGDPFAQAAVGMYYYLGCNGYPFDEMLAQEWDKKGVQGLRQLAEKGNSAALYDYGNHYLNPMGSKYHDEQKGRAYIEQAAAQGYAMAYLRMARYYDDDSLGQDGVDQYRYWIEKAIPVFEQQANDGVLYAKGRLYFIYSKSAYGIFKDSEKAHDWQTQYLKGLRELVATYDDKIDLFMILGELVYLYESIDDPESIQKVYILYHYLKNHVQNPNHKLFLDNFIKTLPLSDDDKKKLAPVVKSCIKKLTDNCY